MLQSFATSTMRLYRTSKDINEYAKTSYRAELKGSTLGNVCFVYVYIFLLVAFSLMSSLCALELDTTNTPFQSIKMSLPIQP